MTPTSWIQVIIFALATLGSLAIAGRSLLDPSKHGFYRFFAFEAIFGLIALDVPAWFEDPLSLRQIVSWVFLAASLGLAVYSYMLLRRLGKPAGGIEQTTRMVSVGIYRFIRHPLYASLVLFACGALLKRVLPLTIALTIGTSGFLLLTALAEERENLRKFGPAYADYLRRTRRFIPFVF